MGAENTYTIMDERRTDIMLRKVNFWMTVIMVINGATGFLLNILGSKKRDLLLLEEVDRAVVKHFKN